MIKNTFNKLDEVSCQRILYVKSFKSFGVKEYLVPSLKRLSPEATKNNSVEKLEEAIVKKKKRILTSVEPKEVVNNTCNRDIL